MCAGSMMKKAQFDRSVLLYFTFLSHLFPLPCGAGSTVLREGFDSSAFFPGVLWLWHFLYSVGQHTVSSLHICTFVVSRAFMAGAASQAGDADSSRAPGLTSALQGSVNVHRGALLLVPQWQCISSFVFYMRSSLLTQQSCLPWCLFKTLASLTSAVIFMLLC